MIIVFLGMVMSGFFLPFNIEKIAKKACRYSRMFILAGSTQLINNTFDEHKKDALLSGIRDLRSAAKIVDPISVDEIDDAVNAFKSKVSASKKYSLGNCDELAHMALDYVVNHAPDVNAEIYHIEGGDHVFLVLGRKPSSDPHQPETWGRNAYICDPWSNIVYPAAEYLTKTKNYYRSIYRTASGKTTYTNHTEDFDSTRHKLSPYGQMNTSYIRDEPMAAAKKVERIYQVIKPKMEFALEELVLRLNKILTRLEKLYGKEDSKYKIISEKIIKITHVANEIKAELKLQAGFNYKNWHSTSKIAQEKINSALDSFNRSATPSRVDQEELLKCRNEKAFASRMLKFFGIKPKTARDYDAAIENSTQRLADLSQMANKK